MLHKNPHYFVSNLLMHGKPKKKKKKLQELCLMGRGKYIIHSPDLQLMNFVTVSKKTLGFLMRGQFRYKDS